jgi:hypothetical protein
MTKFYPGQKFKYRNNGTIIYRVISTHSDGACEAKDEEGDNFTFEYDELVELTEVK